MSHDWLPLIRSFAMHCLFRSPSQAEPVLSRDGSGLDDDFTNGCHKFELMTTGFFCLVIYWPCQEERKLILLFRLLWLHPFSERSLVVFVLMLLYIWFRFAALPSASFIDSEKHLPSSTCFFCLKKGASSHLRNIIWLTENFIGNEASDLCLTPTTQYLWCHSLFHTVFS